MEEYTPNDDTQTCVRKLYSLLFSSDESAFDDFFLKIGDRLDCDEICKIAGFGLKLNLEGRTEVMN